MSICGMFRSPFAWALLPAFFVLAAAASVHGDEYPGLHNVNRAGESLLVGSEPEGEVAFEKLKELGVQTIVSVDGAPPDLAMAKKHGLRYIHIPIGYDGIPRQSALAMARVAKEAKGLTYVHCHHGKHRGPAAAAIICLAAGTVSKQEALELMKRAGTGKDYTGLWRDVEAFTLPEKDEVLPELTEVAKMESIATAMAKLDRHFDHVKLMAKSGWKAPKDHPDLVAATESLLVEEGLTESLRNSELKTDAKFAELMSQSIKSAGELREAIRKNDSANAEQLIEALSKSCARCHAEFRN